MGAQPRSARYDKQQNFSPAGLLISPISCCRLCQYACMPINFCYVKMGADTLCECSRSTCRLDAFFLCSDRSLLLGKFSLFVPPNIFVLVALHFCCGCCPHEQLHLLGSCYADCYISFGLTLLIFQ